MRDLLLHAAGYRLALRDLLAAHGMDHVAALLRDYVFSYRIWLVGLLPCLLLAQRWRAVHDDDRRRASFLTDTFYPVLTGLLLVPFVDAWVELVMGFYRARIPFLNTGLLDGKPMWLQLLGAFLITDLAFWFAHMLLHKVRW